MDERRPAKASGRSRGGWRMALTAAAAATLVRLLRASVRLRFHDDGVVRAWERGDQRFLLAFWHRHLLLMRYAYQGRRMTVLVSRSRDGELIARVLGRLGIDSARGSSSRGGALGLRDLLRRAREGSDLAVTPDGPRGPARKVQPGIVLAAAASGLPVVPVAIAASRAWQLSNWDQTLVPRPGSRVEVVYGEAVHVPRDARPEDWDVHLEMAINRAEERAESIARGKVLEA